MVSGPASRVKLDLGEVILGLPPLAVQQKVNTAKHYLKICIIPSDTDRLRQFVEDTNNLQVPELKSAMKEVYGGRGVSFFKNVKFSFQILTLLGRGRAVSKFWHCSATAEQCQNFRFKF